MKRQRFLTLLVGALVVIGLALYLGTRRNAAVETQGAPFLPGLAGELDSVTEVGIRKGSAVPTTTLHKVAGHWTVAERADYPADAAKLRKLLLTLGDAKIVEEKTTNPVNFPLISVEDPATAGAGSTGIVLTSQHGKREVIVGKPVGEATFVRRGGENQSYTVEPAISVETEPRSWIDPHVLDVPVASIQSVEVKPVTGTAYVVHRIKTGEDNFSLDGVPSGRKALDARALAPASTMLSNLDADDVAAPTAIDFSKATQAVVTLADGNVITVSGATVADKHWILINAGKDAALDARVQGRIFEIASYRYDAIFRSLDQLLVPKEPPAAKPVPAPPQ